MFCQYCGKEVNDNAVICVHCGRSLSGSSNLSAKNRVIYIVLALFFGGLGVHNFYAGYNGRAAAQLLLSLLGLIFCLSMIPIHPCGVATIGMVLLFAFLCFLSVSIWVIVDICTVNKDANGVPFEE